MSSIKKHPICSFVCTILFIFAIISIIVFFSLIGKQIEVPFNFSLKLDRPIYFTDDDINRDVYTIIDNNYQRLSILDKDKKVHKQINFDPNSDELTYACSCCASNNDIYVFGVFIGEGDTSNDELRIIHYTYDGEFIEKTYSQKFDENNRMCIYRLDKIDDYVKFVEADSKKAYIKQIKDNQVINLCEIDIPGPLSGAIFVRSQDAYIFTTNLSKSILYKDNKTSYVDIKKYLGKELNVDFDDYDEKHLKSYFTNLDTSSGRVLYAISDYNSVYIQNFDNNDLEKFTSFDYEFEYIVYILFIWISIAYLLILIIALIVFLIYRQVRRKSGIPTKVLMGIGAAAMLITVSLFGADSFYNYSKGELSNRVQLTATYLSSNFHFDNDVLNDKLYDDNIFTPNQIDENMKKLDTYSINAYSYIAHFFKDDLIYDFNIYGYSSESEKLTNMFDLRGSRILGSSVLQCNHEDLANLKNGNTIVKERSNNNLALFVATCPISNNAGNFVGVIQFTVSLFDVYMATLQNLKNQLIVFSVALLAIYLFLMELSSFVRNHLKFLKSFKKKIAHSEVHITETMEFLKNLAYSVDSVLCVLISKGMLDSYGLGENGVLIGLPIIVWGLGSFLGTLIYPRLIKHLSVFSVFMIGSVFTALSMLGLAMATFINSFVLFVGLKLIYGIAYSFVHAGDATLPMCIEDKKLRFEAIRGSSLSEVSAPILSVLAAGLIATTIGNYAIYVFGVILGILMILVTFLYMPRDQRFAGVKEKKKVDFKVMFKFVISPPIFIIVIVCLVSLLVGAYKSFLFPLLTDNMSISKAEISNYFIIASALVYILSRSFDNFTKKFDHWYVVAVSLVVLGIIFGVFFINKTLLWSIFVFFLSALVQKSLNAEWRMLWPRKCEKENIDPAAIQPFFSIIDSFGLSIRTAVLGSFLVFGIYGACVALGATLLLTAVLFVIITRKGSLRK